MDKILEIIQNIHMRNNKINNVMANTLPITDTNLKKYLEYTKIHGPSSVILYKLNNRLLLFFRDVHIEPKKQCNDSCSIDKNNCVWISDFLKDLFTNAPSCIDFFCETTTWFQIQEKIKDNQDRIMHYLLYEKKLEKRIKGLMKTKTEFIDCLSPYKLGCSAYKTTRFHNIEFRRFAFEYYNLTTDMKNILNLPVYYLLKSGIDEIPDSEQLKSFIDIKKYNHKFKDFLINLNKYKDILETLLNNDMLSLSNIINSLYNNFDEYSNYKTYFDPSKLLKSPYPKLWKQLNTLQPVCQIYIKQYIRDRYKHDCEQYITKIHNIMRHNNVDLLLLIEYLNDFYTNFSILIFDAYTIARMMKAIFNYDDSSLIITYAGGFHIQQYEDFFNKFSLQFHLEFEKITDIGKSKDQSGCIQLNDNWNIIISQLQEAFNNSGKCAIKEGIPFDVL